MDGMSRIKGLIKKAQEFDSPALALTDHGVMYGIVDFYKKAKDANVKPIMGCEIYMSADDHKEKKRKDAFHLTVWARDLEGYQNLMKIVTLGQLEGFYYKPRIDMNILEKYGKGLMASSGCPASLINTKLRDGDYGGAKEITKDLVTILGKENFYIELQRHEFAEFAKNPEVPSRVQQELQEMARNQQKTEKDLLKLSREMGLPVIATNDVHYVDRDDAVAQDAIVCIQTGKLISDEDRMRYIDTPTYYMKTPDEMAAAFADLPEAIENTVKLAEKVDIEIKLGEWYFPKFEIPKDQTAGEVLRKMAYDGAEKLLGGVSDEARERLDYELKVIDDRGYSPYFLIYSDMTKYCRANGIYINTRGSAAGSLVSYCCGITTVDPLRYGLPFERFLNPFRPSPPDIDLDISDNRRDDLIGYLKVKYGEEKVAQICTFGTMQARGSVRDVGRVLGMPYSGPDRISKMIPPGKQGFPMTINRALEESSELKDAYNKEPETKELLDLARKIEGNARHVSVHAAAVVVGPEELTKFTPLQREPGGGDKIITQYEMHASEDVGMIKLDILGIRNLSIMADAIRIIKKLHGKEIDIYNVPIDDEKTFKMLARGETFGVFQLGSSGMTRYLMELQPERIEDIMQMVALYRPGPMSFIPEYIKRKHDPSLVTYADPRMEEFLKSSYGIIVYQDDVLFMAINLAGYNWGEADKFRKAIGKKIPEEMEAQHGKFVDGCVANGMKREMAEDLFSQIETFAAYGFNKGHAASYGMVSYWTAYLKANYPVEYMTALLTAESGNTDKLTEAISECERMGIKVLAPSVNESLNGFTIVRGEEKGKKTEAIRFGLGAIKNVGEAAVEVIVDARKEGPFKSFTDFCVRVDQRKANKRVLESLIKAGAMDEFGERAALIAAIDVVRGKANVVQKQSNEGQESLFGGAESNVMNSFEDKLPEVEPMDMKEKLKYEKELLGFFLSENPVRNFMKVVEPRVTHRINQLDPEYHVGQTVKVAGGIGSLRQVFTKKNNSAMAFGRLEDDTGGVDIVIFPKIYEETKDIWQLDKLVLIKGKVDLREDSINLIVDEVTQGDDLKEEMDVAGGVELMIPRGTSGEVMKKISQKLKNSPGDDRITVIVPNGHGPRRIVLPYGVNFDESLQKEIKTLLG